MESAIILEEIKSDEAFLMKQLALKQVDALGDLYNRYGRLIYSIALNSVADPAVAEEIVQDVFTQVWEKASTYDASVAKVSTWLARITRNRAIDVLRRAESHREKISVSWQDVPQNNIPQSPGLEEETELARQQELVRAALETLSANEREVLAYAYFKGYSHSAIAEVLDMPLGTVKTRIRKALQKLRILLSQEMIDNP